jgi:hypothetical protein
MKIKIPALLAMVCMNFLFCPGGWAQSALAKIPFAFKLESRTFPAGTYKFQVDASNPGKVKLINLGDKATADATIQTRLAQISAEPSDVHLVFDKMDEDYFLSEFWLPGQDGFFLGGTGHIHTHTIIHGTMQR